MNVLIDYFFVIGPSSEDGAHPKGTRFLILARFLVSSWFFEPEKVLAHLPKSVPWNKLNKATLANLSSMCLPKGSRAKPDDCDTNFHSFLLTKEDGTTSWGHSLEFWNPSGGLSHSLVLITTRPLILAAAKILHFVYETILINGITLESFSNLLSFLFSLQDSHR